MGISAIKFEHRDGVEWVGWQQANGDTTTDYVEQVKAGPDWELFRPAYEAWQAELIDTGDQRTRQLKKDEEKPPAAEPKVEPEPDDDDDRPGSSAGRRTVAKGYRK